MRLIALSAAALAAASITVPAFAIDMPETKVSMETCMSAALAQVEGEVKALKLEIEAGKPLYEFEIEAEKGGSWEIECDAMTGEVVGKSRAANRTDPEFRAAAKLVDREARAKALAQFPGKVTASEPQVTNGKAIFEIEIEGADGQEYEVEVDAATGEIVSTENESDEKTVYEIGG